MSIYVDKTDENRNARDLRLAHTLCDMGVPVFAGRLTADGKPDKGDRRWARWQNRKPDHGAVESWNPGDALCAVTGVVFDVLDWDPRNDVGGASFKRLSDDLGDDGPVVYWTVRTPRGGRHSYIAAMGIGSHVGFMPGLDLKGGRADGSGRGFVFLPPTERYGTPYRPEGPLASVNGNSSTDALKAYVTESARRALTGSPRKPLSALKHAVLTAGAGAQRGALLAWVHELERKGYDREDILALLREFLPGVKNFDGKDPWYPARGGDPDRHLRALLHRPGVVVGDARPGELDGIEAGGRRPVLVQSFANVERRKTSWLWKGYLARGELTVLDGEKGVGKSIITDDVVARLSKGSALPEETAAAGVTRTLILSAEASIHTETGPRLDAAGADSSQVFCRQVRKNSRGKVPAEWVLPNSADKFSEAILSCDAGLAIFDPVNDFLAEDIQTHNDASVRRALRPLVRIAQETGCAIWLIRHLNKDTSADIRRRGAGSTAYQNIARVHLAALRPSSGFDNPSACILGVVDSNIRKVEEGSLAYLVVDSDIEADDADGMVPRIDWLGWCGLSVHKASAEAGGGRPGPRPVAQEEVQILLEELFAEKDTWPAAAVLEELRLAGCSTDKRTVGKAKAALGIRSVRAGKRRGAGGLESWNWTIRVDK